MIIYRKKCRIIFRRPEKGIYILLIENTHIKFVTGIYKQYVKIESTFKGSLTDSL